MQKIRKILRAVSEKIALPTNQAPTTPILQDLADTGPTTLKIRELPLTANSPKFVFRYNSDS